MSEAGRDGVRVDGLWAVGVDGCRAGWVAACDGALSVHAAFADVLAAFPATATLAVDMPIGLQDVPGSRPCDRDARALLGPRRSSVFPPPARADLRAADRPAHLSVQSWNIVPRIRELDDTMTRRLQRRIVEAHPELAYATGGPMRHAKRTGEGLEERRRALGLRRFPTPPRGARMDDALDALALARTAQRVADGVATRLGGERDARGLRMEIVY